MCLHHWMPMSPQRNSVWAYGTLSPAVYFHWEKEPLPMPAAKISLSHVFRFEQIVYCVCSRSTRAAGEFNPTCEEADENDL